MRVGARLDVRGTPRRDRGGMPTTSALTTTSAAGLREQLQLLHASERPRRSAESPPTSSTWPTCSPRSRPLARPNRRRGDGDRVAACGARRAPLRLNHALETEDIACRTSHLIRGAGRPSCSSRWPSSWSSWTRRSSAWPCPNPGGARLRQAQLSWVFNAYVVAFGGLLLLGGKPVGRPRAASHLRARVRDPRRRIAGRGSRRLTEVVLRAARSRAPAGAHRTRRADATDDALRP